MQGDHPSIPSYGGGASPRGKSGWSAHGATPVVIDARPLGRRPERRHDSTASNKHNEEARMQQAKRAALVRLQTVGATGNYRAFDSHFGNYLLPVIPVHLLSKPQSIPSPVSSGSSQSYDFVDSSAK
ncbi:hypothetical protein O6H91_13G057800 [Diphasiastrum complanatum]|uniref:Uncharacterized protein n=1 Tax=Diphasiastrum complanatum TaxID=34168 RepID=A0ACC2BVK6_DIPCM|nr:hypothetical protein O6H91_13G057800 [Diphasiastrum complanatum]